MKKYDFKTKIENIDNSYLLTNRDDITTIEVDNSKVVNIVELIDKAVTIERNFVVKDNAVLNYIKIGRSEKQSSLTINNKLGKDTKINIFLFDFKSTVNEIYSELVHEGASININSLVDLKDKEKTQTTVHTKHISKNSYSDIKFKQILDDNSVAKVDMISIVENSAKGSKAFQNARTTLLSDDASAFVTPHLEISIDELEASHGSTFGELDNDSIYYLQSRGINEESAKEILLDALREEVYEKIDNELLIEFVRRYHV